MVVLEDGLYYWKSTVLLEDLLWCWKMNGRSKVLLENQLYWRQSTGLDGNYQSRKITARRWLHKYVGAECSASSFTWYLYQMCNTDVRLSIRPSICPTSRVRSVAPTVLVGSILYLYILLSNFRRCAVCTLSCKISRVSRNVGVLVVLVETRVIIWLTFFSFKRIYDQGNLHTHFQGFHCIAWSIVMIINCYCFPKWEIAKPCSNSSLLNYKKL